MKYFHGKKIDRKSLETRGPRTLGREYRSQDLLIPFGVVEGGMEPTSGCRYSTRLRLRELTWCDACSRAL